MSNSPKVDFTFENNNVVQTTPSLGVSFVYAATTKGPVNDPSTIISSFAQFQRMFGTELIKDNPVSNIEKALKGGSKLRICRVAGASSTPGSVSGAKITFTGIAELAFSLKYPYDSIGDSPKIKFTTSGDRTYLNITINNSGTEEVLESIYLYAIKGGSPSRSLHTVSSDTGEEVDVMALSEGTTNSDFYWDIEGITKFNDLSQYLNILVANDMTSGKATDPVKLYDYLNTLDYFTIESTDGTITNGTYVTPTKATDFTNPDVMDSLRDYPEVYQVTFSGINHMLTPTEVLNVHKVWADTYVPLQEYTLYIEVPYDKTSLGINTPVTQTALVNWVKNHIGTIGNSKYIAYFGGGNKFYDSMGMVRDADCIGTVLGLGDTCATSFGPWKSFAGLNRGVMWDVVGPVTPNYGSPSRYDQLNELANNYINMVVIKDTPTSGKQTVLWHLFTSQFKQDSERFLSIVRLNLYLKKTLRPILEKYIEEANHWITWKNIFLEVKPILDQLVDSEAMSQYSWMGDQNANSYEDLTVNTEQDVRQGKYKVILRYKDIVPMQEITVAIVIDKSEHTVSITEV